MPTMRDMAPFIRSERMSEIVDHGAEVGAGGQALLEAPEQRFAVLTCVHGRVPLCRARDQCGLFGLAAVLEPLPLAAQAPCRLLRQPAGPGLLQRFLHLGDPWGPWASPSSPPAPRAPLRARSD